jgi:hypothetical protein
VAVHLLRQRQGSRESGQALERGIVIEVVRVGALEIVVRQALGRRDHAGLAAHVTSGKEPL